MPNEPKTIFTLYVSNRNGRTFFGLQGGKEVEVGNGETLLMKFNHNETEPKLEMKD